MRPKIRSIVPINVPTYYGAVRLLKIDPCSVVNVATQTRYVDVTRDVRICRPLTEDEVEEYAQDIAREWDADLESVVATISASEHGGLPVLWIIATASYESVHDRAVADMRDLESDHGRVNWPDPHEWDRIITRRLERGLVPAS